MSSNQPGHHIKTLIRRYRYLLDTLRDTSIHSKPGYESYVRSEKNALYFAINELCVKYGRLDLLHDVNVDS